ncbi:MAG: NUMOD4 domain-containing protein [Segatella copri]
MEEIWKDIEGYEGLYQVSNFGRVRSLRHLVKCRGGYRMHTGKTLTPCFDNNYFHVTLHKNGKRNIQLIHRLVAGAFLTNTKNLPQVNHKDGNKLNNNVDNLEWCSTRENCLHAFRLGLNNPQITHYRGVKAFRCDNNSFVGEFDSIHSAAKKLGLNVAHVCSVLHGRYKHTGGYYFEYNNKEKLQNRNY